MLMTISGWGKAPEVPYLYSEDLVQLCDNAMRVEHTCSYPDVLLLLFSLMTFLFVHLSLQVMILSAKIK